MAMKMNPNLPEEILIDIFARVPAKSVGKFRCLSKPWRALLSSPSFIKSHLTRQTHQQNLLFISPSGRLHTISTIKSDDETVSRELDLSNNWDVVVGSCNGLVLLRNEHCVTFLVNPVTQEQVKVPEPPECGVITQMLGFGYDCVNDDYKIVSLSDYSTNVRYCYVTFVDVYSVKLGVWSRLHSPAPYDSMSFCTPGVFVKRAIHLLAASREPGAPSVIAAFDLGREEFYEIPAPIDMERNKSYGLYVLEGCLCVMNRIASTSVIDIWMLNEYNKKESWEKFRIFYRNEWIIKPLCFIGVEEVVLISEEGTFVSEKNTLVVYNFKDRSFTNLVVDGVSAMFTDVETFTESLLSPDFNNENRGNIPQQA